MKYTIMKHRSSWGLYLTDKDGEMKLLSIHKTMRDAERAIELHYTAQG